MNHKCPKCSKEIDPDLKKYYPFCSKNCKDSDLFGWLSGEYYISREVNEEDWQDPDLVEDIKKLQDTIDPIDPYDPRYL